MKNNPMIHKELTQKSTIQVQPSLASTIRQDMAHSGWCGHRPFPQCLLLNQQSA